MVSIIVAVSKNNIIGNNGTIPWKIKGEQKRFKDLTTGKSIIMGRKSFEEIGKPLPNRKTILISDGDVSFPEIKTSEFKMIYEEKIDGEIPYTYYTYERIRN